jgi:hypothetical protein
VIDLVRETGGWKVEKFEWTGDKPNGFDQAVAQSPVRRASSGALEKVPPPPPAVEAKPEPIAKQLEVVAPVTPSPPPGGIERSRNRTPCEIKPVMTDDDLLNCGASPR